MALHHLQSMTAAAELLHHFHKHFHRRAITHLPGHQVHVVAPEVQELEGRTEVSQQLQTGVSAVNSQRSCKESGAPAL